MSDSSLLIYHPSSHVPGRTPKSKISGFVQPRVGNLTNVQCNFPVRIKNVSVV